MGVNYLKLFGSLVAFYALLAFTGSVMVKLLFYPNSKTAFLTVLKYCLLCQLFGWLICIVIRFFFPSLMTGQAAVLTALQIPLALTLPGMILGYFWERAEGRDG